VLKGSALPRPCDSAMVHPAWFSTERISQTRRQMMKDCLLAKLLGLILVSASPLVVAAQPQAASNGKAADGTYLLRYRFSPDESIRYQVTHVAKTKTRIRGAEEVSHVHTVSEKLWEVGD